MQLSSTFRKISKFLAIEFDELAKEIEHSQESGQAREHALIGQLRKYLPQRVAVDRGFVIDASGKTSKQQDVIIYDRTVGTVFEIESVKYYPCESVIAVGEVKASINSSERMRDALDKIRSVKELDRSNGGKNRIVTGPGISFEPFKFDPANEYRDQIFGFIFTSGSLERDTLIGLMQEFNKANPKQVWPNLFCDFKRWLISYEVPGGLHPSPMAATYLYCTRESEIQDLLLLFFCILATFVDMAHVARPSYFDYGGVKSTGASYHSLFGDPPYGPSPVP
jgi:hypothetical protein